MSQTTPDLPLAPAPDTTGTSGAPAAPAPAESAPAPDMPAPDTATPDAPAQDPLAQKLREHEVAQRASWQAQVDQWRRSRPDPQLGGEKPLRQRGPRPAGPGPPDPIVTSAVCWRNRLRQQPVRPALLQQHCRRPWREDGLVRGEAHSAAMPPLEERMYAGWSARARFFTVTPCNHEATIILLVLWFLLAEMNSVLPR